MTRPLLFTERCPTCIFWPGNRMHLGEGRLAEVVEGNRRTGAMLICHTTLDRPVRERVMCRGYWDAYAATSMLPRAMERMFGPGWFEEVDPAGLQPGAPGAHTGGTARTGPPTTKEPT